MGADLTLTPGWSIELTSAAPPARLAAEELRRTLQRIGAPALPIVPQAPGPRIALRHGPAGDGFLRAPDPGGLLLRGDGPRGLLYAAYDLLEALGCRWVAPGAAGERLPRHERVALPGETIADRPALPGRSLVIGHDHYLADAEGWVVWAARNRLNTLFIHTISAPIALGACRLRSWERRRPALLPLIAARGLRLELGGHHLRDLLPRRLFRQHPAAFRHDGRRRAPDHNLCPGGALAHALLRQGAARFYRRFPEVEVFHLWPDDLLGDGWCRCQQCAALSPADQALLTMNTLAEALAAERPGARLSYLAYHDTEPPPAHVAPHPALELLLAPRPRSYAHGIAAPANAAYAARLAAGWGADVRAPREATPPPSIFEYYLDGILFKSAPPPLPAVIAADLQHYRAAGVQTVHALMTGDRPWRSAPVNAYLFARLAWDPAQPPDMLMSNYAQARAPLAAPALSSAHAALAHAWRGILDLAPEEAAPRRDQPPLRDLIADPPCDVLDVMTAPAPFCELRLEQLRRAGAAIAQGRSHWQQVLSAAFADRATLEDEQAEWELGARLIEFFAARQQLYVLARRAAPQIRVRAAHSEAQIALDDLLACAAYARQPAPPPGHRLLRSILQLHLDHVADRRLAWPWQRLSLRVRRYAGLLPLWARLRRGR